MESLNTSEVKPHFKIILDAYFKSERGQALIEYLNTLEKKGTNVLPPTPLRFRAFSDLDVEDVKLVVLGQDPYHGPGQAIGRAFAVSHTFRPWPPSLKNIFKELQSDLEIPLDLNNGNLAELSGWVKQGVLLLNTSFSVEQGMAGSHSKIGWLEFTTYVLDGFLKMRKRLLESRELPMPVALLWGSHAQKFRALFEEAKCPVILSAHPSPLSAHRGFFGSRPFSKIQTILKDQGLSPIDWKAIC